MMSWVNTVSLPIRLAASPGAHDHCVPMDEPSAETDTTAIDRSLPSRASPNCSWSTSTMEATASSLTTSVTARGKLSTAPNLGVRLLMCTILPHCSPAPGSVSASLARASRRPSAASKDMLVQRFQALASEVLMHPVHELVGRQRPIRLG